MAKKDLATQGTQAISTRTSFIEKGDRTGLEGITQDDLRLPRLAFAQALSPQVIEGDSSQIPGLKMFDMFNDLSGEIYGRGPLEFIVCQRQTRRIEFIPRSEGGGVKDLDVPADDSKNPEGDRNKWTTDPETKERIPPKATKFVEFVIMIVHKDEDRMPEPVVFAIKDTNKFNRRASERLTGFLALGNPPKPIYGRLFSVSSKQEKNDSGVFAVPVITPVANLDDENVDDATWQRRELLYITAKNFAASLKGKQISYDREGVQRDEYEEAANEGQSEKADRPDM